MSLENYIYLIPLLPLIGTVLNGLIGRRLPRGLVSVIGCVGPLAAFGLTAALYVLLTGLQDEISFFRCVLFDWIRVGDLSVPMAFTFDRLSAVMCLVVTGVGSLIHIYSIGYMGKDPGYAKFFAYLNLFMTMMLILVLGDSLPLLFLGWEGVGLCSYLLIGFWYDDIANASAGKKAFVVNRIGDFGFALGMFLAFVTYGTLDFPAMNAAAAAGNVNGEPISALATFWIPLLLFVGATGKSAQIPLYVWLPDAMAGPTPVSALIHAATMVTSGVYLLNRTAPIFMASPEVLVIVAAIGAITALVAGFIAMSQFDIKKVLAYSTVSQLGYMFLACGLGAFSLGIFHVVTHAFFKGLLFLGAGAVIHSMHHEQDMRKMGGLRKKIPVTFLLMLVGALAISGFPLFAGFFSKDAILVEAMGRAFHGEHTSALFAALWLLGLVTAVMTAFYSFRLIALTFFGRPRYQDSATGPVSGGVFGGAAARDSATPGHGGGHGDHDGPVVESPWVMLGPMTVLALFSIGGGLLAVPEFLAGATSGAAAEGHGEGSLHTVGLALGVLAFLVGVAVVWFLYGKAPQARHSLVERNPAGRALFRLSSGKLFVDEIYDAVVVKPLSFVSQLLFLLVDRLLIDGLLVAGSGLVARLFGGLLRRCQSGRVPTYAGWVVGGAVILLLIVLISSY